MQSTSSFRLPLSPGVVHCVILKCWIFRGKIVLGYTEAELRVRGSGYQFIHAADMLHCAENHVRSKSELLLQVALRLMMHRSCCSCWPRPHGSQSGENQNQRSRRLTRRFTARCVKHRQQTSGAPCVAAAGALNLRARVNCPT